MSATLTNGQATRRQLSDQLDRLDLILDGLAVGLNDAIADAAREGARLAVKEAVIQILTDPDLRARMAVPSVPAASSGPGLFSRLKTWLVGLTRRAADFVRPVVQPVTELYATAAPSVALVASAFLIVWRFKRLVTAGVGVGLVAAVACYVLPHPISALLGGLGAGCTALAAQATWFLRRGLILAGTRS